MLTDKKRPQLSLDELHQLRWLLGSGLILLSVCTVLYMEVEAWLLAGHVNKLDRPWSEVRQDVSVKERVFDGFLAQHGDPRRAGGGRDLLMEETLRNYGGLIQRCPELAELQERIASAIERVS